MDNNYQFLCSQFSKMKEDGIPYNEINREYQTRIVMAARNVFGFFYKTKSMALSESKYMLLIWCYSIFISNGKIYSISRLDEKNIALIDLEINNWTFGSNNFFNPIDQSAKRKAIWMLNKFSDIQISGQPFILNEPF